MRASRRPARPLLLGAVLIVAASFPVPLAGAAEKEAPWKIDEPHGPTETVRFTVDEGTWLQLDVHPSGDRIVVSLLGDLYLLPIGGGEAERITSGTAYDIEPRFSPDGKRIAFSSDRSGLESLWVCDLDGGNARQISEEKSATVTAPSWTPDGDYLVGRKRLTDVSSLGAVELWMWHLGGGSGVQLTKSDAQPQAADPEVSPDGRFVFFSSRPSRYSYNRNVNSGIWQIARFDRRTGQILSLTGEYGGAAVPRISPDGASMAYVRRDRAATVLEVMDLATGAVRRIASGLTRDDQEGFSAHGVFPGYAWTPDGTGIVATAEGRIWRWDVATGRRTAVPFSAEVEQQVTAPLVFSRRVGVDDVRARIVRWPVEPPDGRRLVYSALGHLWIQDLPSGVPRRLTDTVDLEYAPAFSRDGSLLTYVTWNDREGGHVWALDPSGRPPVRARRVTDVPGQYANPSFSPDGKTIVFLGGSGATFRDGDPADELWHEIRLVDTKGGPSRYVVGTKNRGQNRRMARPTFSRDGDRIFYLEDAAGAKPTEVPKSVLVSVQLDGTDRREHLRWARAEEAAVSPDGRWVVFSEAHDAWLTALPEAGSEPVEVGLEGAALPLVRLSDTGGEWVGWADGGKTVTWIYGPTYRRVSMEDALRKPTEKNESEEEDGDSKDAPSLPEAETVELTLVVPRAKPEGTTAYRGARVVTMRGDEVIDDGTIVVRGDRIVAVGPSAGTEVPRGAKIVDVAGKTIIPGLFDEHAHLHYSTLDIFPQRPWKYLANLAYGVTTVHDPSASTHEAFTQAEMVEAGLMPGPRIFSTGFILYGADNPGRAKIDSLEDAKRHVRRLKSVGAFSVKSYMQPRRDQRQWILEAAREEEMLVMPEGGGDLEMDMTMVLDGHTTIEHALPATPLYADVRKLMGASGIGYAPTLLVAYGGLSGDKWFLQHEEIWKNETLLRFTPRGVVDGLGRIRSVMATDEDWHHIDVASSCRNLAREGVRVLLGSHGQLQGLGAHWEIRAFVQGGMTPLEALRAATLHPAEALGLDRDLGSIEPGKLADFVVLRGNPLDDIEKTETVESVVKNGRLWSLDELARVPDAR